MAAIKHRLALMAGAILAVACVWACRATRNGDGSITIGFAPDMTITAWGLEDALSKLVDLLGQCNAGTFGRPCTDSERKDIRKAIARVLDAKKPPERAGSA